MHAGASAELAKSICGTGANPLALSGSTQTTAAPLPNAVNIVSTATANQGGILRADLDVGESQYVYNKSGVTIEVYPPVGGHINEGTQNAAVTLANGKGANFVCIVPGSDFSYVISG